MTAVAEAQIAPHPADVGFLGAQAVVAQAGRFTDGSEEGEGGGVDRAVGNIHVAQFPYRDTSHIAEVREGNQGVAGRTAGYVGCLPQYSVIAMNPINS